MKPIEPTEGAAEAEVRRLLKGAGLRPELPAEDLAAIRDAARFSWAARQRRIVRRRRLRLAGAVAAALAAVALGVFRGRERPTQVAVPVASHVASHVAIAERVVGEVEVRVDGRNRPLATGDRLLSGTSLVSAADGRVSLRLASDTVLRLDRDTRVELGDGLRLTLSAGGLYADSEPGGRLEIATPGGVVRDIGTQFVVRVDGATAAVSVAIREGHVELHRQGRVLPGAAGEALLVEADGRIARRSMAADDESWRWITSVSPAFAAEGRTFGEFLTWFEREAGQRVDFAEPTEAGAARAVILHGSLLGLDPSEALDTVAAGAGYEVSQEGDRLLLRPLRTPSGTQR